MKDINVKHYGTRIRCTSCGLTWETKRKTGIYCPRCRCDYGFESLHTNSDHETKDTYPFGRTLHLERGNS